MVSWPSSSPPPSTITIISIMGIIFIIIILFIVTTIISPSSSSHHEHFSVSSAIWVVTSSPDTKNHFDWVSLLTAIPSVTLSVILERSLATNFCAHSFLYSTNVYWKSPLCRELGQATETQLWIRMNIVLALMKLTGWRGNPRVNN